MADPVLWLAQALWLMGPAYVANMSAVKVGGGAPMDGGRVMADGRRMLGDGKTWRGFLLGGLLGTLTAGLGAVLAPMLGGAVTDFGGPAWPLIGIGLAFGALLGDAGKSFLKRRVGLDRGASWMGPDQLDFVVGAWLLVLLTGQAAVALGLAPTNWLLTALSLEVALMILIVTPALHLATNWLGHRFGHKEVPW